MKVAIDAGHGRKTPGKRCLKSIDPNQTREWVLNDRIASKVASHLRRCGAQVLRTDDVTGEKDVSLSKRVRTANGWDADFFVSIHHNAGIRGGSGGGPVVFVYSGAHSAKSNDLQANIYYDLIAETGKFGNRSVPLASSNLYVLRKTDMPAVLVECGFMDSTVDTPMILTEEFSENAARGIARGICAAGWLPWQEERQEESPAAPERGFTAVADIQRWAGCEPDGIYGPLTHEAIVKKVQAAIGVTADGIFGVKSRRAWPVLKEGSRGDAVRGVQGMLICRGYSCGDAGADGIFGGATAAAVKTCQRVAGLTSDAVVGTQTATMLFT